ncbi:MAG TPA: amylo-alpha-1,6-glucosidase [Bryobacteraceae bacterium]|nr:amylo-alpha-1,6-glucosidase [Bryobacteraceae bacterium]
MTALTRRLAWPGKASQQEILDREWIVTNGLGGYASGTVAGVITRRFHGLLVAALPNPFGRRMMLNDVAEQIRFPDGRVFQLGGEHTEQVDVRVHAAEYFAEFRLENGLPVWQYQVEGITLEKRLLMPHRQNTVHINYRVTCGTCDVRLELRPAMHFRPHEGVLGVLLDEPYVLTVVGDRYEFSSSNGMLPPLRLAIHGSESAFTFDRRYIQGLVYHIEQIRGYDAQGSMWSPGYFHVQLTQNAGASLVASTETWDTIRAMSPAEAEHTELERRRKLIAMAHPESRSDFGAELVLAADQFIITPAGRAEDMARARAGGDEVRTVIAGYHWFTDWGRDTMISLEGLTLTTGRWPEAGWILRTFAYYVRHGLIPNMFPEGEKDGLYHTADATLWFFHAVDRYVDVTKDRATLRLILPKLVSIVRHHMAGTKFGIQLDPADGLLCQGAPGYQLTWMDAKVEDWVVTPRRGKAVEINALWYNALCLLRSWISDDPHAGITTSELDQAIERACEAFNARFWYEGGGYLYDVIDGENGNDTACRPNQVLSISLKHPVLDRSRWDQVLEVVKSRLVTPVGLRSLAPGHPDYKSKYYGDLRSRDAAYHQGTVWGWLIGPFIDAWLKAHPEDRAGARKLLLGFEPHLHEGAIGTISEIFDAEQPFAQRGCVAQAWSVAEVLRCWVKTAPVASPPSRA